MGDYIQSILLYFCFCFVFLFFVFHWERSLFVSCLPIIFYYFILAGDFFFFFYFFWEFYYFNIFIKWEIKFVGCGSLEIFINKELWIIKINNKGLIIMIIVRIDQI